MLGQDLQIRQGEPSPELAAAKSGKVAQLLSRRPDTQRSAISIRGELSRPLDDSLDVGNDLLFEGGCVWEGWYVR